MGQALPDAYLTRMQAQLCGDYAAYLRAMQSPPPRALRVNGLKCTQEAFERLADFPLTPVAQARACYRFPDDVAIGRHPLHLSGQCYVQEPSAQQPVQLLGVRPGMTVLDLCAAPGGKSGQIAELLAGEGLLIANEPIPARARALLFNLERLGVQNAAVINQYPDVVCAALFEQCDAVLVDAPCSGEGMFRREPDAVTDWSPTHVLACAERQTRILDAAATALKPGGVLVYATCTFSPEEDEGVVQTFLRTHPHFSLEQEQRLYPHSFPGEGQYMAKLVHDGAAHGMSSPALQTGCPACRLGESSPSGRNTKKQRPSADRRSARQSELAPWEAFCAEQLTHSPAGRPLLLPDGRVVLLPKAYPPALDGLRILRAGVLAGELRQGRFIPAHALYLALPQETFVQRVALSGAALDAYLCGEAVPCDAGLSGWCAAVSFSACVGFGKAVAGTLKNHLPKGLRRFGADMPDAERP